MATGNREETLKLLVYMPAYWPLFGGHAHHLRSRLRLLPQYGIEPWVLTPRIGNTANREIVDEVLIKRVRLPWPLSRRIFLSEAALFPEFFCNRYRYDLVSMMSASVSGYFISKVCRRPVIRESVIGENHAGKFKQGLGGKVRRFLFRHADFAVTVSPALEQAYLDVSWPKDRLCLIPYGVDQRVYRPPDSVEEIDRLRSELNLPNRQSTLFLTVGAIQKRKGHLELVQAWRLLSAGVPDEHLIIIGPINEESYYRTLLNTIEEMNLNGRVHLPGRSERIADYMRCVDGFVFASNNEGLPISIIEAISSGLPVVAFDLQGILPFIIDDGKNGILIPGRDQVALSREIRQLSSDPIRRAEMGQAARAKAVEKFSLDKEVESHAELCWTVYRDSRMSSRS